MVMLMFIVLLLVFIYMFLLFKFRDDSQFQSQCMCQWFCSFQIVSFYYWWFIVAVYVSVTLFCSFGFTLCLCCIALCCCKVKFLVAWWWLLMCMLIWKLSQLLFWDLISGFFQRDWSKSCCSSCLCVSNLVKLKTTSISVLLTTNATHTHYSTW